MTTDKLFVVGLAWTGLLLALVLLRIALRRSTGAGATRALPVVTALTALMVVAVGGVAVVRVAGLVDPPATVAEGRHDGTPGAGASAVPASGSAAPSVPSSDPDPTPAPVAATSSPVAATPSATPFATPTPTPEPKPKPRPTETPRAPAATAPVATAAPLTRTPSPARIVEPTLTPTPAPTPTPASPASTPAAAVTPLPMEEPADAAPPAAVPAGPGTLTLPPRVRVYTVEGGQVTGYAASWLKKDVTVRGVGPGLYAMPTLSDPAATTRLVLVAEGQLLGKLVSLDDPGVTFTLD